jgi:hypothetical protein
MTDALVRAALNTGFHPKGSAVIGVIPVYPDQTEKREL